MTVATVRPSEVRAQREALRRAPTQSRLVRVFVASSSDVREEREKVRRVVDRFHAVAGDEVTVRLVMWEDYDTPDWQPPQEAVWGNTRFDEIELFIGVFWWRAGIPVEFPDGRSYPGGTFAELDRARKLYEEGLVRRVLLYFCDREPPAGHDSAQRTVLEEERRKLEASVFFRHYGTPDDFAAKLLPDLTVAMEEFLPPRRAAHPVPAQVTKLCDRYEQEAGFAHFFAEGMREHRGTPQACILWGEKGEGHEGFVERILATRLQRMAAALWPEQEATVADYAPRWPEGRAPDELKHWLRRLLFDEFHDAYMEADDSAAALTALPAFRRARLVVLHHDVYVTRWTAAVEALIRWYFDEFWAALPPDPGRPEVLVVLKLVYLGPERGGRGTEARKAARQRLKRDLQALCAPAPSGCRRILLPEFQPVQARDVEEWLDRYCDVPPRLRARALAEQIFRADGRILTSRSMEDVEDELRRLLADHGIPTRPLP